MAQDNERNGWNEWSKHIIRELERLNTNSERLREDLQNSNIEISKLQGLQKDLAELKHGTDVIKREIEKNAFRFETKVEQRMNELMGDLTNSIKEMREENSNLTQRISELEGQKKYIRGMMVALAFIITTIIAVLALFDWGSIGG